MKHRFNLFVVLCTIIILNNACTFENINYNDGDNNSNQTSIVGEGDLVEKVISLDSFTKLNLVGQANINIIKGTEQSVKIKAQQNILDVLVHEVSNNEFKIGIKDHINIKSNKGIYVDIVTPSDITDAKLVGTGKITIANDMQDAININITGVGNVDAYNLEVDNCTITLSGVGKCYVKVNKKLEANISGVGKIYYKGTPEVIQNIGGIGSITSEN